LYPQGICAKENTVSLLEFPGQAEKTDGLLLIFLIFLPRYFIFSPRKNIISARKFEFQGEIAPRQQGKSNLQAGFQSDHWPLLSVPGCDIFAP